MPRKILNFELDIYEKDIINKFKVKQFDDCTLNISLKDGEKDFNAQGSTGVLYLACDNEVFMQNNNIIVSDANVSVTLNRNLLSKSGCAYAELELSDEEGTISSLSFLLNIEGKIGEGATIPGGIEGFVETYNKLTSEMKKLIEESKKLIEESKTTSENIKEDYKNLRKIIIDENNSANLQAQIDELRKIIEDGLGGSGGSGGSTPGIPGPPGPQGPIGATPQFTIGNVVTLEPGQQATVTLRGTAENPILDFGIPRGRDGINGGVDSQNNLVDTAKVDYAILSI